MRRIVVFVDVNTEQLERSNGDLIVGESGDPELGQLKVVTDDFLDCLFPGRHACLSGGQERAVDIPEQNDHAICGTT